MNKKAFTLIELIGVIVIIAIISLIVFPRVLGNLKTKKDGINKVVIKTIKSSASLYVSDNKNKYKNNKYESYCIPVQKLIDENYLVDNLSNEDKEKYVTDKYIKATYTSSFNYKLTSKIECLTNPTLSGLTPVIYDGNNWIIADVTRKWYNYENQEWANAVILKKGISKNIGDTITVDGDNPDALAMFVWIPRYEYKIEGTYGKGGTSVTSPGEIEVNFISSDTKTASSGYRIHPAFWWDDNSDGNRDINEELSGIWVGKFETTGDTTNPTILPNYSSLSSQSVSSQFITAQSFNSIIINSDSHMMKNSEWGVVAYLSQSIYGKYGNNNYDGINKEIYQNKSTTLLTGSSNGTPSQGTYNTQCVYNDTTNNCGIGASTTGNITGIYDMSGGAWEYVMGVRKDSSGNPRSGYNSNQNSGFNGLLAVDDGGGLNKSDGINFPESKYYDLYDNISNSTKGCSGGICYGHALSETAGWYDDNSAFVAASSSWFARGGNYNSTTVAGVWCSSNNYGNDSLKYSFRVSIVLP